MGEYVLEMNNITKVFPGVKALDGVTLKVRPGSVHALMGENGAGKSTLMKCLFGIYHEDGGEIILDGKKQVINTSKKQALDLSISTDPPRLRRSIYRPENASAGKIPRQKDRRQSKTIKEGRRELFKEVGLDIDPEVLAGHAIASNLQLVEIARGGRCFLARDHHRRDEPACFGDGQRVGRHCSRLSRNRLQARLRHRFTSHF